MALGAQFSLIHSEFNAFLFASLGEEKNGSELTVLSALTRLGFDPWREAARLSRLPKDAAARALATTIALLPEAEEWASDARAIAARLVERLPGRNPAPASPIGRPSSGAAFNNPRAMARWAVGVAIVVAALFVIWYWRL